MNHSRKCMSIDALVDHGDIPPNTCDTTTPATFNDLPLTPPSSCKSRSPTPASPEMEHLQCYTRERRSSLQPPMSVEERRYRNKLASAKYRAKKQESMKSMANKVSQLMTNNSSLQKELSRVKQENEILRAMLLTQQTAAAAAASSTPSSVHSSSASPIHYHRPTAAFF